MKRQKTGSHGLYCGRERLPHKDDKGKSAGLRTSRFIFWLYPTG